MTNLQVSNHTVTLELIRLDVGREDAFCLALVAWDEDCHEVKLTREELVEALREQDQTLCPVLASAKKLADAKRQSHGWLDPILLEVERFYREPDEAFSFDFHDYHPEHCDRQRWLSIPPDPRFLSSGGPCRRD